MHRRAELALAIVAAVLTVASSAEAQDRPADCIPTIDAARYDQPTTRYPHGALGDDVEWGALSVEIRRGDPSCPAGAPDTLRLVLPEELVFEDTAPRLADVDGDTRPELIVVESHRDLGARLAVWGFADGQVTRRAATPFIGTRFRWLSPLGAADLDGDGAIELSYVDRPHLARVLRVWRWQDGSLVEVAALTGVTNHQYGAPEIGGGIRHCGAGPELVLADAAWRRVLAVTLAEGALTRRDIGPYDGPDSFAAALDCRPL